MRSPFVAAVFASLTVACAGRTRGATAAPDPTARYYARAVTFAAEPNKIAPADSGNQISRDSARALLGDFLLRDLDRTVASARAGQEVSISDWGLPPRSVFAIRMPGDSVLSRAPLVSNGFQKSIAADSRRGITYSDMVQMMKDLHVNPGVDYVIDTTLATAPRARAVLDSGIVLRIDFVKPRTQPEPSTPIASSPNGMIRILTRPKAPH